MPKQNMTFKIVTDLRATKADASGILVRAGVLVGGKLRPFGTELIPLVKANETHRVEFLFHRGTCGPKLIRIESEPGRPLNRKKDIALQVACDVPTHP